MKHIKILMTIFILVLVISQPVQASAKMSLTEKLSQTDRASATTNVLMETITVHIYPLAPAGGLRDPLAPVYCLFPDDIGTYGCGDMDSDGDGIAQYTEYINREEDYEYYLKDVIALEMNLAEITPDEDAEALKAQAIASRTLVNWKAKKQPWQSVVGWVNNSTQFQVFIPGVYKHSAYKAAIDEAMLHTRGQFLQYLYFDDNQTIDAEFGADMPDRTRTEYPDPNLPVPEGWVAKPYLTGVEDPISTSQCFVNVSGSHDYGMSQRGAIRWAKGNVCPDGTGALWPVKWDHTKILVHYYTGIDIVDDRTGNKIVPDDRWNLIWHNVQPGAEGNASQPYGIDLKLQNTSTSDWNISNIEIAYQWTLKDTDGKPLPTDPLRWEAL